VQKNVISDLRRILAKDARRGKDSFAEVVSCAAWESAQAALASVTEGEVRAVLSSSKVSPEDVYILLSPQADHFLEALARKARALTLQRFGRTVVLYVPLYLSSYCMNSCLYCGFRRENPVQRKKLSPEERRQEMLYLRDLGFQHILLVSGEDPRAFPLSELADCVSEAHRLFASVSIEVYPLAEEGYRELVRRGCDGIALYQETYNPEQYRRVHPRGPKRNMENRLNAIEYAARAGMRSLGLGALLGLSDWRVEGIFLALHASYLMKRYWRSRIAFSFPRLCPAEGGFRPPFPVSDRDLVHLMCALRLAFPDAELVVSTREPPELRDNLISLGVATRYSAGSRTEVGGYSLEGKSVCQFEIHDTRSPSNIARVIQSKGYDPVWKDWDFRFLS